MSTKVVKTHKNKRVVSVCNSCKEKKLKCDKARPSCSRCLKSKKTCVYPFTMYNTTIITPPEEMSRSSTSSQIDKVSLSLQNGLFEEQISPVGFIEERSGAIRMPSSSETSNYVSSRDSHWKHRALSKRTMADMLYKKENEQKNGNSISLELWNLNKLIVSYGSTTYYDFALGSHGLIQYDPYTRLLCGALHGNTVTELQSKLTCISSDSTETSSSENKKKKLGPLNFLEQAIIKWVKMTNEYVKNQLPLDYFNTTYTIEDTMHPNLFSSIQMIIREIEIIMIDKEHINYYLRLFYENIYPYYPLIEIPLFEKKLKDILVENHSNHYEFNVFHQNIRIKLETLVMFLLILSLSLRSTLIKSTRSLSNSGMIQMLDKKNASDIATQLIVFAQKLLSLLNGFKFTNENILCCTIYLFIAEHLHAGNRAIHVTHDEVLTLNCISNLANTLGLYNDPGQFERFKNSVNFEPFTILFKRKLWISLQSIKLQTCTLDGSFNEVDLKHLEWFKLPSDGISAHLNDRFKESTLVDFKLFTIQEDIYEFHILLGKVMSSISTTSHIQYLDDITEHIERLLSFMNNKFSLDALTSIKTNSFTIKEESWRQAVMNLDAVKNLYTVQMNIIGKSSVVSIYSLLFFYFEQKCISGKEDPKWIELYELYMTKSFELFLDLTSLTINYLNGSYSEFILSSHQFCLNKIIIFTLIKIWRTLLSFALRLSYKREMLKRSKYDVVNHELELVNRCLYRLVDILAKTVDFTSVELEDDYIGADQALQMIRYIYYIIQEDVTEMINSFWNKIWNTSSIPERIVEIINIKWGVGPKNTDLVKEYLANEEVLGNIIPNLLEKLNQLIDNSSFTFPTFPVSTSDDQVLKLIEYPDTDTPDMLDSLLEANFELFTNMINDSMGELPALQ